MTRDRLKPLLLLVIVALSFSAGQGGAGDRELSANVLVILKEPYNLKTRLDSIVDFAASGPGGYAGAGETPRSVEEAAGYVEHSTHMIWGIHQGVEYRGCFILSDVMPAGCREWLVSGDPQTPDTTGIFRRGYLIRRGEKMIRPFALP